MGTIGCTVVGVLRARPERRDELLEILRGLVAPTRREEGCVDYHLHVSDADPNLFMFYENWRSREDLDRHLGMPHLAPIRSGAPSCWRPMSRSTPTPCSAPTGAELGRMRLRSLAALDAASGVGRRYVSRSGEGLFDGATSPGDLGTAAPGSACRRACRGHATAVRAATRRPNR